MVRESLDDLKARAHFAAQENVFHEQLAGLNTELSEARERGLSAEQWQAASDYFEDLCAAVATFRSRWRAVTAPPRRTLERPGVWHAPTRM